MSQDLTYSARAVQAAFNMLTRPSDSILNVSEHLSFLPGETDRTVSLELKFTDPFGEVDANQKEFVPFVFLTPRRGKLISISSATDEDEDRALNRLTHNQHQQLAKLMIAEALWQTFGFWLTLSRAQATNEIVTAQTILFGMVETGKIDLLATVFDEHGHLKSYKSGLRPTGEPQLYMLCKTLAERYFIAFDVPTNFRDTARVRFDYRAAAPARFTRMNKFRELAGTTPNKFREPLAFARRTSNYFLYANAPSGYYFHSQKVIEFDRGAGEDILESEVRDFHAGSIEGPAVHSANVRGAPTMAHIYVANGSETDQRLDASLVLHEIPFGSAGVAFTGSLITVSLILGTFFFMPFMDSQVAAIAPLLLSIVASLTGSISLFSSGAPSYTLTSRTVLLATILIGNLAALRIATTNLTFSRADQGQFTDAIRFLWLENGKLIISLIAVAIVIRAGWRLIVIFKKYGNAVNSG